MRCAAASSAELVIASGRAAEVLLRTRQRVRCHRPVLSFYSGLSGWALTGRQPTRQRRRHRARATPLTADPDRFARRGLPPGGAPPPAATDLVLQSRNGRTNTRRGRGAALRPPCRRSPPRAMPDLGAADGTTQTVYIGNLAFEATQDDLWRFLEARYGAVRSVRVMTDQQTHASRGYGFATFAAHRAAAEVCAGRQEGGRAGGQEGGRAGGPEPGCVVCRKGTCSTTRRWPPARARARPRRGAARRPLLRVASRAAGRRRLWRGGGTGEGRSMHETPRAHRWQTCPRD